MAVVVAQHGLVAVAQPQRGVALPLVREAAGLGELVAGAGLRRRRSMAPPAPTAASWRWSPTSSSFAPAASTCAWIAVSAAVSVIADSSTTTRSPARSRHACVAVEAAGRSRPAARRSWVASQRATLRAVRPSSVRTSVATWLVASPNTRPALRRRRQVGVGPGAGERADDEALAGAGRADEGLDPRAGGEHAADGGGLVDAELDARRRAAARGTGRATRARQRGRVAGGGRRRRRRVSVRTCSGVA